MIVESTEMVEYTTASRLAAVYEQQVARVIEAMGTVIFYKTLPMYVTIESILNTWRKAQ